MDVVSGVGPGAAAFSDGWDRALELAWEAFRAGSTPVGAVVVDGSGAVVAVGRGRRYEAVSSAEPGQLAGSHIAHAEVNALAQLGTERHWEDHVLLTTLEPCPMCHGAAIQATVGTVLFAGPDPYGGTAGLVLDTPQRQRRPFSVMGPLADWRGALATLLHVVWLMERPSAAHVVEAQAAVMPLFVEWASSVRSAVVGADEFEVARSLAQSAPIDEFS